MLEGIFEVRFTFVSQAFRALFRCALNVFQARKEEGGGRGTSSFHHITPVRALSLQGEYGNGANV